MKYLVNLWLKQCSVWHGILLGKTRGPDAVDERVPGGVRRNALSIELVAPEFSRRENLLGLNKDTGGTEQTLDWQGETSPEMVESSSWRFLLSSYFALVLPSLINTVCWCCKFASATDTLLPGQFLNAEQSLVSKNGAFKLGYDCSVPLDYYYYSYCGLGIWFANRSARDCDYFPVWQPVQRHVYSDYNLSVTEDGMLNLSDLWGSPIWSSPYKTTTSFSAVAVLLDNGNLVIRDQVNNSRVNWQSFDNPTNILLGGRLGFNTITRKNVTLVSYADYMDYRGYGSMYTLAFDATRRRGFTIQKNSDGPVFAGTFPRWMDIREDGGYALTFHDVYTYIQLDRSGVIRFTKRGECNSILWSSPQGPCYFGTRWGADSLCTTSCSCKCPAGFYSDSYDNSYCLRKFDLSCESESIVPQPKDTFSPIDGIYVYPRNALPSETMNMSQCESSCLRNCSCTAFAYYNTRRLLWFGKLWDTIVLDSGSSGNRIYIRIRTQQELHVGSSFQKKVALISVVGVLGLIVLGLFCLWRCRRKIFDAGTMNDHGSLMIFSFVEIQNSTKKFSEKLGEGGFGCVFKALLPMPGCTVAAVKKLKDLRQEEKQFRAEVQSIGLIQHINIVRLGAEYSQRFLVYEYMENGSLSNYLFSKDSSKLSWELRYSIALGIARGLAYLHEGCKDCIVHCDIKPDNILLDDKFCPKIADFGMAKLLGRDFSRVLTTMRGTIGYLAPEWISGVPITHKADVYSYGMVLLEIISGRRNSKKFKEGKFTYFPIYAAVKVNEGDVMCLLDSTLKGLADAEQLNRACRVACWCIQDAEDHRPMMGQIVRMLEGVVDVEVPPIPRSLQNYVGMEDSISADLELSEVSY